MTKKQRQRANAKRREKARRNSIRWKMNLLRGMHPDLEAGNGKNNG